eukprot:514302_1
MLLFFRVLLILFTTNSVNCEDKTDTSIIDAPVTIGAILNELISNLETISQDECIYYKWLDQHAHISANRSRTERNEQCDSIKHLLKSFVSVSIYSLYFKDICNTVWYYDEQEINDEINDEIETNSTNATNRKQLKYLINSFISHDKQHWEMFINDWRCLGLDETDKKYSDLLVYLFGDLTFKSRKTVYETIKIDAKLNGDFMPEYRYIIISLLEYFSGVQLFPRFGALYDIYQKNCDDICDLVYVSLAHCDAENSHVIINEHFDSIVVKNKKDLHMLRKYGNKFIHA